MICSIHQPNYIPYLGLFNKIKMSDVFVFYDIAQYTKWDYHNRNTIKWANWTILLSLPVSVKFWQTINEVKFDNSILQKHLKTIKESYKKSKFYSEIITIIEELYLYKWNNISEFNINCIKKISSSIWLKTNFFATSDIFKSLDTKSTDALISICKYIWASEYISWSGWKKYLEIYKFKNNWLKLTFQDFHHPIYKQLWWDFVPYMSVIDTLFNEGLEWTYKIL